VHLCINLTWLCQNECDVCWLNDTIRARGDQKMMRTRPMADWTAALHRDKPKIVDIAGGEPLLVPWLPDLLDQNPFTKFGLSTNALSLQGVSRLCQRRRYNVISINASIHPDCTRPEYERFFLAQVGKMVNRGYPVHCNLVDYGDDVQRAASLRQQLEEHGVPVVISPYERTDDLGEMSDVPYVCKAGHNHLVIAPDGTAWPCLTALRSPRWEEYILGNWLDGTVDLSKLRQPCHLKCTDYLVLKDRHSASDPWGVEVRTA